MRPETRRQGAWCDLNWGQMCVSGDSNFPLLCVAMTCVNIWVANKFQQVGEFTNTESEERTSTAFSGHMGTWAAICGQTGVKCRPRKRALLPQRFVDPIQQNSTQNSPFPTPCLRVCRHHTQEALSYQVSSAPWVFESGFQIPQWRKLGHGIPQVSGANLATAHSPCL